MKFTITRINKQNKLMVSSKTVERFLERIAKDDAKLSVTNFRMSVPLMEADYQYYKGIKEWQHVYPAAEFSKAESGNLVFLRCLRRSRRQKPHRARKHLQRRRKNPDKRSRRRLTLPVCLRTGKDALPVAGTGSH